MSMHYIKEIEIKSFKCFRDFSTNKLKRVNLIGGKNNVGKTALMEACFINSNAFGIKEFVGVMQSIKFMRENLNILANDIKYNTKAFIELLDGLDIKSNINHCKFLVIEENATKRYLFEFNQEKIDININDFSFDFSFRGNSYFIDNFGLSNQDIVTAYSYIQMEDREEYLNSILNEFDNSIEAFKVINDKPFCKVDGKYLELTELGDGTKHIVSILTTLFKSKNGYLYIDEIDNGIYYLMLDRVWEIILKVSKELNVQLFATTHSKECIESYARVAKRLNEQDITFIELCKRESKIKPFVYDYDWFLDEIEQGHEVRGCL